MTVLHGPIKRRQVHGLSRAARRRRTRSCWCKEFPTDAVRPVHRQAEFALCFTCHKRDLLQYPDTSFATDFRDGERNLHYLHVNNKQKGRSCVLCHDLHGGSKPKLIADSVPFGKWRLPLKFVKTETGGSCSPGCHKPQSYDRKSAAKAPPGGAKPPAASAGAKPATAPADAPVVKN